MENKLPSFRTILSLAGAVLLIVILVLVFQLPSLSPRHFLIGNRTFGTGTYWALEIAVGAITSMIITLVAAIAWRKLALWIAALSIGIQVLWLYVTQTYLVPADSLVELLSRLAEPGGIVFGAAGAVLLINSLKITLRRN